MVLSRGEREISLAHDFIVIIFPVVNELYAVNLKNVREIITLPTLTPLPNVPPQIIGLIPLRSELLTVIDLKLFLQFPPEINDDSGFHKNPYVLIIEDYGKMLGILIEGKTETIELDSSQLQTVRTISGKRKFLLIKEEFKWKDKLVGMLDISKLLTETRYVFS